MRPSRRTLLIGAAVFLAGVPTAWAVFFEEIGDITLWARTPLGALWVLVAVATARVAIDRDDMIDELMQERADMVRKRLARVAEEQLARLLEPGTFGIPTDFAFTIYTFDPSVDLLQPTWPEDPSTVEVRSFEPGRGATGRAWQDHQLKLVTGPDVSNAEYELTPTQQEFFAAGKAVVAAPIDAPDGTPMGVLTAFSEVDDRYFEDPAHQERFRDLAALLGAVLDPLSSGV